jgi:Arc/MetJ-type ribon-helix-helix transcriptional regulator
MLQNDRTVRWSVSVPQSIDSDLEIALSQGEFANRSQAVSEALRALLDVRHIERLRAEVALLRDDETPDEDYVALRRRGQRNRTNGIDR